MVYRGVKGSPLTNTEVDTNFQNLDTYKAPIDEPTFTTSATVQGQLTAVAGSGALIASNGGGTGQTSILMLRAGAAVDQGRWELLTGSDGAFSLRTINDAYSANATILKATRAASGYGIGYVQISGAGNRTLIGSGTDDGVNALQVTGNIESDSKLILSGSGSGAELGSTSAANTPVIDFHSSGNNIDYDARIAGSSGSATVGAGNLTYYAGGNYWNTVNGTVMLLNGSGRLMIGTTTDDGSNLLQVNGGAALYNGGFAATSFGGYAPIRLRSAGGTQASPTALGTATQIGGMNLSGYDGSAYTDVATISAYTEEAFTTSAHGTQLRFFTTKAGTTAQKEAMRLTGANRLLVNQTSDDGVRTVQVTGGIANTNTTDANPGILLTGLSGFSAGMHLLNSTASTGRKWSVYSANSGAFTIGDETSSTARVTIDSAGLFTFTGNTTVTGTSTVTGATNINGLLTANAGLTTYGLMTVNGGAIELGQTSSANTPFIDFHSSGNNIDYDSRIIASGGSATMGNGTLTLQAGGGVVMNVSGSNATLKTSQSFAALFFSANNAAYVPHMRANSTNSCFEWVNSANSAVNMTLSDSGGLTLRSGLTVNSTLNVNGGLLQMTSGGYYGYISANPSGWIGFINSANNQWNLYIYDGGDIAARGVVRAGGSGGAYLNTDGNINGTAWGGWLSNAFLWRSGGTMTGTINCGVATNQTAGALHINTDWGTSWNNWTGTANAAVQMDCPSSGSAYYGLRFTHWGDKHLAALGAYEDPGNGAAHMVFLVGTDTAPGFWFNSGGNGTYATSWTLGSDYRIKKDVVTVDPEETLTKVLKLRPVEFGRIEEHHGDKRWPGYIAHEVQELFPLAVHGTKDAMRPKMDGEPGEMEIDPQSVDYIAMSSYYVAAIQALSAKLDKALSRIDELESKLAGN
jgi:hypothetical protein